MRILKLLHIVHSGAFDIVNDIGIGSRKYA